MKKSLIIAAIVLGIGVPVATIAHRQLASTDRPPVAKAADSSCPASEPVSAATPSEKVSSCPFVAGKKAQPAKAEAKRCPMTAIPKRTAKPTASKNQQAVTPALSPAPAKPISKPVVEPVAAQPVEKAVESAVCPVMGSTIPDVSKAAGSSVYKGKTYYFCCGGCKPQFDKDPEKYAGS